MNDALLAAFAAADLSIPVVDGDRPEPEDIARFTDALREQGFEIVPIGDAHEHAWQPAGIVPIGNAAGSVLILLLCKCGETSERQYDL